MLHYLKAFSVFFLWTLIALTSHYYINNKLFNKRISTIDSIDKAAINKNKPFLIRDASNTIIYSFPEGFAINSHNANVSSIHEIPFLKDSIKYLLINDYSKELIIIGKYSQHEADANLAKNLGLQRAEYVKEELINEGVNADKIRTFGKQFNFSYNKDGIYTNGIEIKLNIIQQSVIDSLEFNIAHKTLYIGIENEHLIPTKNLFYYTLTLKQYLQKYSDKKIRITGHTDNLGYYENNLIIGLNSAKKVQEYFVENGIDFNRTEASSKGESEPIADKTTEKGRAKNRRIELEIN